jgi:outer membrane protein assembly factor BamA
MFVDTSAQASIRQWVRLEAAMGQPKVANGRLFWEVRGLHHNYNSLPFYGQGPNSEKIQRTNYRLENTDLDGMFGVHVNRVLRMGVSSGYMWNNVGPGQDNRYASSEVVFRPAQATGIDRQTNFFRWGGFVQADFRDDKAGPRSGGNYTVRYDSYNDRDLKLHGFQRVDMEGQQYLPFFNKRRVIVLRGRVVMTKHDADQSVPFYLQSVLGGSNDLRGFRPYRFYDENMMVMNAEYRWEVFAGMDMAIFADAGKVTHRRSDLDFRNLESAVGSGLRFNARDATFIRLDVGFSHEGFQVWVKFNDVFAQRPFGSSAPSHIF